MTHQKEHKNSSMLECEDRVIHKMPEKESKRKPRYHSKKHKGTKLEKRKPTLKWMKNFAERKTYGR